MDEIQQYTKLKTIQLHCFHLVTPKQAVKSELYAGIAHVKNIINISI